MHLIFCVDGRDGLSFCGRRLSRDRFLSAHIQKLAEGSLLWISPYSAELFDNTRIQISKDFLRLAKSGHYCFIETLPQTVSKQAVESVILYCWNRSYPATDYFDRSLLQGMTLAETREFPGSSHEKITMERYIR